MIKIKLNESEARSLIQTAIKNVTNKTSSSEPIRIGLSEIRTIIKKALVEYRNQLQSRSQEIDIEYVIETGNYNNEIGDYQTLVFIIRGDVTYSDQGIGSYEFQGSQGFQEDWGYEVEDYNLVEGTYNPTDKADIDLWIKKNHDKIVGDLTKKAEDSDSD